MNDQIIDGVMKGMKAAADRFADRMREINEANVEQKRSQFWKDYAFNLAERVDDLTKVLNKQNVLMAEREVLLRQTSARVEKFKKISNSHASYLNQVVHRLLKVEDMLQRQSANSFALDEFRKLALAELESIQDPKKSNLIDPVKRGEILDAAWKNFMETQNVKRGVPHFVGERP